MPGVGASARAFVARGFTYVEDVVYVGLGVLLAGAAVVLLADGAAMFWRTLVVGELPLHVINLLEHALIPEPFLVVALIAGIRRVLVLTAEFADLLERGDQAFANAMIELGLLTMMILVLVVSLLLLRRRGASQPVAEKG